MIRIRRQETSYAIAKEDDYWILYRENTTILERAQWLELRAMVDRFYDLVDDATIEEENRSIAEKQLEEMTILNAENSEDEEPLPGYIYLIHGEGTYWYKIGVSVDPIYRLKQLGTQGPFPHKIIRAFAVDDMYGIEAWWHRFFADKRAGGEWFVLDGVDTEQFIAQAGRPIS